MTMLFAPVLEKMSLAILICFWIINKHNGPCEFILRVSSTIKSSVTFSRSSRRIQTSYSLYYSQWLYMMNHLIYVHVLSHLSPPPHIYVSKCVYVYVHISLFLPEYACTTIIDISPRIFSLMYCCCVSIIFVNCICPPGALIWLINLFLFKFLFLLSVILTTVASQHY